MGLSSLDKRGRIVIPKEFRQELGLKPDQTVIIELRGREIILKPALEVDKFIEELRGCVHGSRIEPSELKEIWGTAHAQ